MDHTPLHHPMHSPLPWNPWNIVGDTDPRMNDLNKPGLKCSRGRAVPNEPCTNGPFPEVMGISSTRMLFSVISEDADT